MSRERDESGPSKILRFGRDVSGGVVGVGAVVALKEPFVGPPTAVAAQLALQRIGEAVSQRWLEPRQAQRVANAFETAVSLVRAQVQAGATPRSDWFADHEQAPEAEEVVEQVLLAARDAGEQRKVPILGRFLANVAFDSGVSAADAHQLVGLIGRLTYRQLVMLSVFGTKSLREGDLLRRGADAEAGLVTVSTPLRAELLEIRDDGLIGVDRGAEYAVAFEDTWDSAEGAVALLTGATITDHGHKLYRLGGLQELIADAETFLDELLPDSR